LILSVFCPCSLRSAIRQAKRMGITSWQ
jgi:hypothetical protein